MDEDTRDVLNLLIDAVQTLIWEADYTRVEFDTRSRELEDCQSKINQAQKIMEN